MFTADAWGDFLQLVIQQIQITKMRKQCGALPSPGDTDCFKLWA